MGEHNAIEWTDHTCNLWLGCSELSPGCDNCFAHAWLAERLGLVAWGHGAPRRRTSPAMWRLPYRCNRRAAWEGRRPRVFTCSLADLFAAEVPPAARAAAWRRADFHHHRSVLAVKICTASPHRALSMSGSASLCTVTGHAGRRPSHRVPAHPRRCSAQEPEAPPESRPGRPP